MARKQVIGAPTSLVGLWSAIAQAGGIGQWWVLGAKNTFGCVKPNWNSALRTKCLILLALLAALVAPAQTLDPVITTQPVSTNLLPGDASQFSVIVTGTPPFSYQWRKAGTALTDADNIQGATAAILTITNLSGTNAGFYDVVVTKFQLTQPC